MKFMLVLTTSLLICALSAPAHAGHKNDKYPVTSVRTEYSLRIGPHVRSEYYSRTVTRAAPVYVDYPTYVDQPPPAPVYCQPQPVTYCQPVAYCAPPLACETRYTPCTASDLPPVLPNWIRPVSPVNYNGVLIIDQRRAYTESYYDPVTNRTYILPYNQYRQLIVGR